MAGRWLVHDCLCYELIEELQRGNVDPCICVFLFVEITLTDPVVPQTVCRWMASLSDPAMKTTILRFFTFEVMNIHPMIYWGLLVVWCLMLVATFASIGSQAMSPLAKLFWSCVVLVPIVGLFLYLIFCLTRVDYSFMAFLRGSSGDVRQLNKKSV